MMDRSVLVTIYARVVAALVPEMTKKAFASTFQRDHASNYQMARIASTATSANLATAWAGLAMLNQISGLSM